MSDLSEEEVEQVSNAVDKASDGGEVKHSPDVENIDSPAEAHLELEEISKVTNLPVDDLERMRDIKVKIEVQLGRTRMPIEEVLQLETGRVVELNYLAGEPVDVIANNRVIAKAEVVVIEDSFGIKILEIVDAADKLRVLNKPILN